MNKAIRNAEIEKIPVVCVIGPRDLEAGAVSVRTYVDGELGQMPRQDLVARIAAATRMRTPF
jgi:threonyl-tRNA synthetase